MDGIWSRFKFFHYSRLSLGVSLIESLIVMAMMGIFLGLSIPALRQFNQTQNLKAAALALKSDLRLAQDNAISGKRTEPGPTGTQSCASDEVLAGWWVALVRSNPSYYMFGLCVQKDNPTAFGRQLDGKKTNLPPGVQIKGIYQGTNNMNWLGVFFMSSVTSDVDSVKFLTTICSDSPLSSPCPGHVISGSLFKIELGSGSSRDCVYVSSRGQIYESKTCS